MHAGKACATGRILTTADRLLQANWLKAQGIKKGDAVAIYMPMLAELPIAMLACARIGAVHSVIFAGFSPESIAARILDCKAKVVLAASAVKRGKKAIDLKSMVDKAVGFAGRDGFQVIHYFFGLWQDTGSVPKLCCIWS